MFFCLFLCLVARYRLLRDDSTVMDVGDLVPPSLLILTAAKAIAGRVKPPTKTTSVEGLPVCTNLCRLVQGLPQCILTHLCIRTTCLQRPLQADPLANSVIVMYLCTKPTCLQRPLQAGLWATSVILTHLCMIRNACLQRPLHRLTHCHLSAASTPLYCAHLFTKTTVTRLMCAWSLKAVITVWLCCLFCRVWVVVS